MKKYWIGLIAVLVIPGIRSPAYAAESSGESLQLAIADAFLLDEDSEKSRNGAQMLFRMYPTSEHMDVVAERLLKATETPPQGRWVSAVAFSVALLTDFKSPRYAKVLREVHQRVDNESVRKTIDKVLPGWERESVAQYVGGSVDVVRKRATAVQALTDGRMTHRPEVATVMNATLLPEILNRLGAPDELSIWRVRNDKVALHYKNSGFILAAAASPPKNHYESILTAPEVVPLEGRYHAKEFGFAQVLAGAPGKPLALFVKTESNTLLQDTEAMNILVERMMTVPPENQHRYETVAYVAALERMWMRNAPHAMDMLERVATLPDKNPAGKTARKIIKNEKKLSAVGKGRIKAQPSTT